MSRLGVCVLSSRHKHWLDGVGVSSRRKRRWLPMVPTRTISASSNTCELQVCLIVLYFGTLTQNLGCYWQPCWKHYHLQDQLFSETKLNWIEFQEDALIEFTFLSQYLFFCVIWHCPFHLGIDQTLLHTIILFYTFEHFCTDPRPTNYCTREGSEVNHHLSTRCGRGYIYGKRVKKFWRLPKSRFEQKQSKISAKRSSIPLITTHRKDYGGWGCLCHCPVVHIQITMSKEHFLVRILWINSPANVLWPG